MRERPGDQPLPVRNDEPDIQSMVIDDIGKRRAVGIERYGTPLQPFNGRKSLRDLYEELLDAACYVKQRLVEEDLVAKYVDENERLKAQIDRLAKFIMDDVPGEPSQSQGAVDAAIRIIAHLQEENAELRDMIKWQNAETVNAKVDGG